MRYYFLLLLFLMIQIQSDVLKNDTAKYNFTTCEVVRGISDGSIATKTCASDTYNACIYLMEIDQTIRLFIQGKLFNPITFFWNSFKFFEFSLFSYGSCELKLKLRYLNEKFIIFMAILPYNWDDVLKELGCVVSNYAYLEYYKSGYCLGQIIYRIIGPLSEETNFNNIED